MSIYFTSKDVLDELNWLDEALDKFEEDIETASIEGDKIVAEYEREKKAKECRNSFIVLEVKN